MTQTATPDRRAVDVLVSRHTASLEEAAAALAGRLYYSRYPESPSPRVYGDGAAEAGRTAYEAHLGRPFEALADQPSDGTTVGDEVSPYGPRLGVAYPRLDVAAGLEAAREAMTGWRDIGPRARAAVCVEILDAINKRSFEIANAVMHTSGQPFVMSFQAAGPNAQDRGLEAVVAALVEQERVPESAVWEKPGRDAPIRMAKEFRIVPRGVALVIGCNTFPTWNAYPGFFASLATGNAVVVKPHPRATLPLAVTVAVARDVLASVGLGRALVQLAADGDAGRLGAELALRPEVAIVDYTGGPAFGAWLEREVAPLGTEVYTEKAGVNSVVIDSTDDLRGMLDNLAFSLTLYSGQMCTTPQNIYIPKDGIKTDEGHVSFDELGARLSAALDRLAGDDARAVELLGATVNDGVRTTASSLRALAAEADGSVVRESRAVSHPAYADAVCRAPGLVAVDVSREDVYAQERFGPVTFLIGTESTQQGLAQLADTTKEFGGMTAAVYSTSEPVLEAAREAAVEGGVALSENLTDGIYVNQTAAFSDYHGTGANPAANAAYTDAAFVAGRFRVVTTRRHIP